MLKTMIPITLLAIAATPATAQIALAPGETLLEIQTVGEATARPDIAHITMGAGAEADAYAGGLGLKVVRILRVSERGNYASQDIYVSASRVQSFGSVPPPPPPPPPPPMSGGEIRERATLWIDYALVPK